MATFKVSIVKSVPWKGRLEEFANTYTVKSAAGQSDADLLALAQSIRDKERPLFWTGVTFKGYRVWDVGLAPNYMRVSDLTQALAGTGATTRMNHELAILVTAPLPRRQGLTKTYRRDMRKFLHTCTLHQMDPYGDGTSPQPTAGTPMATYLGHLNAAEIHPGFTLCAPNGDERTGPWKTYPYLVTRQFRRGKKEAVA